MPVTCYGMSTLQLGLHCSEKLPAAEPACPPGPPRPCPRAEDQPHLALEGRLPGLLAPDVRPARLSLTSPPVPATRKGAAPAQSEPVPPSTSGRPPSAANI